MVGGRCRFIGALTVKVVTDPPRGQAGICGAPSRRPRQACCGWSSRSSVRLLSTRPTNCGAVKGSMNSGTCRHRRPHPFSWRRPRPGSRSSSAARSYSELTPKIWWSCWPAALATGVGELIRPPIQGPHSASRPQALHRHRPLSE
jgi:hypothetical protein